MTPEKLFSRPLVGFFYSLVRAFMRTTSRILQVIVILLGAFFLFLAISFKSYLVGVAIIAIAVFALAALGSMGIDPTLKDPVARKYFRVAAFLGVFVVIAIIISMTISLLDGDIKQALRMLASLMLIVATLWRSRREIPDWLRKKRCSSKP